MPQTDLHFYFDPVCPFAWLTSKWVRLVAAERGHSVDWRFISLHQVNAHLDYSTHFPPEYEAGHTAGLRLLRVAARARTEQGPEAVGGLYEALGQRIFDVDPMPTGPDRAGFDTRGTAAFVRPALAQAGLPPSLAEALEDDSWDTEIQADTDHALRLAGKDVGTPIIHFDPPDGMAFFGPVISWVPDRDEALALWDHVIGLARFPGFAELKRSLRSRPRLRALGTLD